MKRFLKSLFRDLVTGPSRGGKPASRRTVLELNGLEDRMVLSSAGMSGSTLIIDVSPNSTVDLYESVSGSNREIEVIGASGNPQFLINPIATTVINVSGNNEVYIDDSNGMPFAQHTTVTFQGGGTGNTIDFFGSRSVDTSGDYFAGITSPTQTFLAMDNISFDFNTTGISSVADSIPLTGGPLYVATESQNVVLSSPNSGSQMLSGLGAVGGSFTYTGMSAVDLYEDAAYATVNLDTSAAASLETQFNVDTYYTGDEVVIAATPSSVSTSVQLYGSGSQVQLEGNSGFVSVTGNSTSSMGIAQYTNTGGSTHGIGASVQVSDVESLALADNANVATNETVKVTQSTISGTGLFGNNAAVVTYSGVGTVSLFSGQETDSYTVEASSSSASFSSQIDIYDESSKAFSAHVDLDANTHLHLSLFNETSKAGELYIDAPGGKFENSNGVVDVYFDGVLSSQIDFQGFTIEEEKS